MFRRVSCIIFLVLLAWSGHAQHAETPGFFPAVNSFKLTDVQQRKESSITTAATKLLLFVFVSPECPLCQNYTKVLNEMQGRYKDDVQVYAIVQGNSFKLETISSFQKKYQTSFPFFIDDKMELTKYLQATVTPQVILLNKSMQQLYSGAIDDWAVSVGKKRLVASEHYAVNAIEQSLHNSPVLLAKTKPVGCKINDY